MQKKFQLLTPNIHRYKNQTSLAILPKLVSTKLGDRIDVHGDNKHSFNNVDVVNLDNIKMKFLFDFINDEMKICINDEIDKKMIVGLQGRKCIIPAASIWLKGTIIQIGKCNFYD